VRVSAEISSRGPLIQTCRSTGRFRRFCADSRVDRRSATSSEKNTKSGSAHLEIVLTASV